LILLGKVKMQRLVLPLDLLSNSYISPLANQQLCQTVHYTFINKILLIYIKLWPFQLHHTASGKQQQDCTMSDQTLMRWLKLMMVCGIALIVLGHYLWVGLELPQRMGVQGIILVGMCCALGLLLSLPTKIYLTLLLMQHEAEEKKAAQAAEQTRHSA